MLSTAARVASPMIVPPKFELPIVNAPPTAPPPVATPPMSDVPDRLDSPCPVATPRISAVVVLTTRASMFTTALAVLRPIPPSPMPPTRTPAPPMPSFLSSRPNCVMLPMMIASTPRMRASCTALVGSARPLCWKFCSCRMRSSCLRSITE